LIFIHMFYRLLSYFYIYLSYKPCMALNSLFVLKKKRNYTLIPLPSVSLFDFVGGLGLY